MGLVHVAVYLKGEFLDPDFATKTLRITPDRCWRKGEIQTGKRSGKTYLKKTGLWTTGVLRKSIADEDVFREMPVLVDELLQRFNGRQDSLDQMAGVDEAFLDILVLGTVKDQAGGAEFVLSKEQMQKICRLGLAIYTTTSFSGE